MDFGSKRGRGVASARQNQERGPRSRRIYIGRVSGSALARNQIAIALADPRRNKGRVNQPPNLIGVKGPLQPTHAHAGDAGGDRGQRVRIARIHAHPNRQRLVHARDEVRQPNQKRQKEDQLQNCSPNWAPQIKAMRAKNAQNGPEGISGFGGFHVFHGNCSLVEMDRCGSALSLASLLHSVAPAAAPPLMELVANSPPKSRRIIRRRVVQRGQSIGFRIRGGDSRALLRSALRLRFALLRHSLDFTLVLCLALGFRVRERLVKLVLRLRRQMRHDKKRDRGASDKAREGPSQFDEEALREGFWRVVAVHEEYPKKKLTLTNVRPHNNLFLSQKQTRRRRFFCAFVFA